MGDSVVIQSLAIIVIAGRLTRSGQATVDAGSVPAVRVRVAVARVEAYLARAEVTLRVRVAGVLPDAHRVGETLIMGAIVSGSVPVHGARGFVRIGPPHDAGCVEYCATFRESIELAPRVVGAVVLATLTLPTEP
jgi:hypothetical protein